MYALKNKVQLIGHLGKNPELKQSQNGKNYARFSLATSESYKNAQGERITDTQWHNIICWGKVADIAKNYLQKGSECALEGKLIHRSYEDKDGNTRYISEIEVREILLLDKKDKVLSTQNEALEEALPF